jgi:very-short-patch-repair endonuclease
MHIRQQRVTVGDQASDFASIFEVFSGGAPGRRSGSPSPAHVDGGTWLHDTAAVLLQNTDVDIRRVAEILNRCSLGLERLDGSASDQRVRAHLGVPAADLQLLRTKLQVVETELVPALARDRYVMTELVASGVAIDEPPPPEPVTKKLLAEAIASEIAELKSYNVADFCVAVGLDAQTDDEDDPFSGKWRYVMRKLGYVERSLDWLVRMAYRVAEELDSASLLELAQRAPTGGMAGRPKNIIFAATKKPDIVLRDAVSNDIEIVGNAEHCLVFDRPIPEDGISWRALVEWHDPLGAKDDEREAALALFRRLKSSLQSEPERRLFSAYCSLYRTHGYDLPALLPQVYLHYDPKAQRQRGASPPLARQRMDFLLLLPARHRIVIEVDGKQHYSHTDGRASPELYARMVREDRALRLAGYEIYRFGGYELADADAATLLLEFFRRLLGIHGFDVHGADPAD